MRLTPICSDFHRSAPDCYILVIFSASAESLPRSSVSGSDLYISDVPDLIPRFIHVPIIYPESPFAADARARARSAKYFYIIGFI